MTDLTKEQIEYQKWAWKIVDRLLAMNAVIAATDKENLRSKEEIQRELAQELSKISLSKFREAFPPSMDLALEALEMRPHVAQFGEGKLEVILGELECEGNVYIVPAKHQGKVGEITPPELRAARDQWHDGEIVLKFPNQLQALLVAAALTNVKPEDWVFEESQSPLLSLQKVKT